MKVTSNIIDQQPFDGIQNPLPAAIDGRGLVKRFGRASALDGLDIRVPEGSVYALLGRNGVGKSTLIQLLMGMLEPTTGSLSVLGMDPVKQGVTLRQRVGYIPDRLAMYDWMTVQRALKFVGAIYPNWSTEEEQSLVRQFQLIESRKSGQFRVASARLLSLVVAMAHHPELVLLDECTSGMDAIARREFERSVINALQTRGRTVLFAGHQIDEMERICDWVGIMKDGRMQLEMPLDTLKETVKMLRLASGTLIQANSLPGCRVLLTRRQGNETHLTVKFGSPGECPPMPCNLTLIEQVPLSLEQIFVALVGGEETEK